MYFNITAKYFVRDSMNYTDVCSPLGFHFRKRMKKIKQTNETV